MSLNTYTSYTCKCTRFTHLANNVFSNHFKSSCLTKIVISFQIKLIVIITDNSIHTNISAFYYMELAKLEIVYLLENYHCGQLFTMTFSTLDTSIHWI